MPHSKRKAKIRELSMTSTPVKLYQSTIPDCFQTPSERTPGGAASNMSQEQENITLASEISLTPGAPQRPVPPAKEPEKAISSAEAIPESPREVGFPTKGSKDNENQKSWEGKGSLDPGRGTECLQQLGETVSKKEMSEIMEITPKKLTLEELGLMIMKMQKSINNLTLNVQEVLNKNVCMQSNIECLEKNTTVLDEKLGEIKKIQVNLIKSVQEHEGKLEMIENQNRKLNLRILNFPIVHLATPVDLFNSYLKNILKYSENSIPKLTKSYYLLQQQSKENDNVKSRESFNLTEFLEKSYESNIENRATLLVQFQSQAERDEVLKLHFGQQKQNFYGAPVRIFPDVIRTTQIRRKNFIALRKEVQEKGAQFSLRYPCKCYIKYQGNSYIFNFPDQLRAFLDTHS